MRKLLIILISLIIAEMSWAQSSQKHAQGYPFIRNFSASAYKGHAQNFAVAMDGNGLMYFGNFAGVLQFDGTQWRLIPTSRITKVSSLDSDPSGKIFVGAREEFGYLSPDSAGDLKFQSLIARGSSLPAFQDVIATFCLEGSVIFVTEKTIFTWKNGKLTHWTSGNTIIAAFRCGNRIYLQMKDNGLKLFNNGLLADVVGGEKFTEATEIKAILNFSPNAQLIATGSQGLFLLGSNGITPFKTPADEFFRKNIITCAIKLNDGTVAIGTSREGILILFPDGSVKQIVDRNAGLANNYIQYLYASKNNLLWAALNNGISLIELPSAFSYFNENCRLNGSVNQVRRFEGRLYVATFQGLYVLNEESRSFTAVPGIVSACWALLPLREGLLAATSQGVFMVNRSGSRPVAPGFSVSAVASGTDPGKIYLGQTGGLFRLEQSGQSWKMSGIPGVDDEVDLLVCDSAGTIWGTSFGKGVFSFDPRTERLAFYDTSSGLPERSGNTLHIFNGKLVAATRHGLYTSEIKTGKFVPYRLPFSDSAENKSWFTHLVDDFKGGGWCASGDETKLRHYRKEGGKLIRVQTPFLPYASVVILDIYPEANGITWFGTPNGLLCYDPSVELLNADAPAAMIRKFVVNGDSLVFGGHYDSLSLPSPEKDIKYVFRSSDNSVKFEFSVPAFPILGDNLYQYKLEGFDDTWSEWTAQSVKEFTNLPKGDFTFHVKAKNVYGMIGGEATFSFRILAPWYTKWWAYVLYILLATASIYLIVIYRNRKLVREKKALERMITERTAEIVQQKEEIENQSLELAGKNDELEKISTVVKAINSEINFSNLLQSLLEKTKIIKAVEKSTALILDKESGFFRFRSSFGWDIKQLEKVQFSLQAAEKRYLKDADEVFEDVFLKRNFSNLNEDMPELSGYEIPRSMLVLAIKVDQKVEAFLILENMTRQNAFGQEDLSFVRNSKEHIISAFIKTRILEDLQSTLDNLKDTQDQLVQSQKLASLGELTAGIAHEIQNPLNFVNNFSTLSVELAKELREYLDEVSDKIPPDRLADIKEVLDMIAGNVEKITDHGKRAASIVKGMLQHSRGKSGEFENVELNNLVSEYVNLAYHGMRAKDKSFNTALRTDLDPAIGKVSIIPQELSRVILNIVNNSCYAVDEKAKLEIPGFSPEVVTSTRKIGNKIEIKIRDNGTGIPQHVIDKIFNPFFTTKPTGKGTGLGLSMSFDIVTQVHKGKLEVNSKEGEFTEFIITIPEQR